jgi:hypothetical protein
MKKPQILILGLVYGFLSVYRLLGSDLTNVKGTVAFASKLKCHCEESFIRRTTKQSLGWVKATPVVAQFIGRSWPDLPKAKATTKSLGQVGPFVVSPSNHERP